MLSAEGVVQHLKYDATFPLLLNIAGEPTYFISLKDNAGLVKQYAMVNVERYQIVATGSTIEQCERTYERMLEEQAGETIDGTDDGNVEADRKTITGTIEDIRTAVRDGNTYYYIKLTEGDSYYSISASDNENVVIMDVGDRVDIEYYSGDGGQIINMASIREVEE